MGAILLQNVGGQLGVKRIHSSGRCRSSPSPRGDFGGFPPNQSSYPPNWNMKHHKSFEFLSIFRVLSPHTQTQNPPAETQSPAIEKFLATVLRRSEVL